MTVSVVPVFLTTSCGHEATVKPCRSKKGPNASKWVVRIRGPKITLKSGVKSLYCSPSQHAAKQAMAAFLEMDASSITIADEERNHGSRKVRASASPTATTPATGSKQLPAQAPKPLPLAPGVANGYSYCTDPPCNGNVPPFRKSPLPSAQWKLGFLPQQPASQPPSASQPYAVAVAVAVAPPFAASAATACGPPPVSSRGVSMSFPSTHASSVATTMLPSDSNSPLKLTVTSSRPAGIRIQEGRESASPSEKAAAIVPTAEQQRIYQHAKPPTIMMDANHKNDIVRITAGAGAGKTTTVLQLAARAARLGHTHITYVTFAKAAADDGARRIQQALRGVTAATNTNPPTIIEARTLHSCAMKLLSNERNNEEFVEEHARLMDDEAMQNFISTVCGREIEAFLAHANSEIASRNGKDPAKRNSMLRAAERQVSFFIFKAFTQFCRSPYSVEQFKDPFFKHRNYYPAEKFHCAGGDGEKQGFPTMIYKTKLGKYADMACLVWDAVTQQGLRTYDLEMKRAQLKALRIPGSLLLVDESQDMDACQVDWISKQTDHGTHVYIVGDAAQTIYSFRGAKSKYMVNLKGAIDFELTKSWRFGPRIASIANVILFSKHKSKQTQRDQPTWQPYRVRGCGGEGIVTSDSILSKWKDMPITVIASFNATLLEVAVSLLRLDEESSLSNEEVNSRSEPEQKLRSQATSRVIAETTVPSKATNTAIEATQALVPIVSDDSASKLDVSAETVTTAMTSNRSEAYHGAPLRLSIPKIHINGKGEDSGLKKWKKVLKQIQHVYELYKSGDDGCVVAGRTFREFGGEKLTWESFRSQVETRELTKYASSIQVVNLFRDKTMEIIALFEREVMAKTYKAEEADVILTTTHAAKGMEWDNVQVCEDFSNLFSLCRDGPLVPKRGGNSNTKRCSWQFQIKPWGDETNLLYVACTRAKKLLSIPSSLKSFLEDCDTLHDFIRCRKLYKETDVTRSSDFAGFGRSRPFSVEEALDLYQDVIVPLRLENKLKTNERLKIALITALDGAENGDEDEVLESDDEFEQFFGYPNVHAKAVDSEPNTTNSATANQAGASHASRAESVAKKPKLARAFAILEQAKASVALAPKATTRPFDKREKSTSGSASCRECHAKIMRDTPRVGVQVYVEKGSAWWPHYFHEKCFPTELLPQLRLDPNRNNPETASAAKKTSWNRKRRHSSGYYKSKSSSWGGGWKKGRKWYGHL